MAPLRFGFIPTEGGRFFEASLAEAVRAEELGFDSVWFEEQLAIVRGLWTEERLTFTGAYYPLEGRLEPRPLTKPHPPVWIGGWGDLTLKRAATLADNWIPGPTAELPRLIAGKQRFLDNRAAAGRTEPIREGPLTRDGV